MIRNKYFKILIIGIFFSVLNCKSQSADSSFLFLLSSNDNLNEIKSIIYIEPLNQSGKELFKIDSLDYIFKFLFYSKDNFGLIPCCVYGEVNNLSIDVEKMVNQMSEEKLDSLAAYYGETQKAFYKELPQIINTNKGFKIKRDYFTIRVFKANNIEYCECSYGYRYSNFKLPNGSEAFIIGLNDIEELNSDEREYITSNLEKILSTETINKVIKSLKE